MGILSAILEPFEKRKAEREAQRAEQEAMMAKLRQATFDIRNNGTLPEPMQSDGRLILDKDEKTFAILPGLSCLEERTSRVNFGTGGASFRVAKGVTIRGGGGSAIPVRQLEIVDNGTFYVTNKKVAFVGLKSSTTFPLKKIVECNYNPQGLHIASATRKTPLIVKSVKQHQEVWDYTDAIIKELIAKA